MQPLQYLAIYLGTFIGVSAVDALWHLVLFKRPYSEGIKQVAPVVEGKIQLQSGIAGLLAQVLTIGAIVFLVLYRAPHPTYQDGALIGAAAGILAISVYGLVNYAFIKDWNLTITILEVVWGPMIGAVAGLLVVYLSRLV